MNKLLERTVPGLHASIEEYISSLQISKNCRVLDLGAGTGAFLQRLGEKGYRHLFGVDIVEIKVLPRYIPTVAMDLNQPSEESIPGQFDLITAIEVVEHIENIGLFFDFLAKKMSQKGFAIITTPNIFSLSARLRFLLKGTLKGFDEKSDQTHLFPICRYTLSNMLQKKGLSILESWTYPSFRTTLVTTRKLSILTFFLSIIIKDSYPGDSLCLLLGRKHGKKPNFDK